MFDYIICTDDSISHIDSDNEDEEASDEEKEERSDDEEEDGSSEEEEEEGSDKEEASDSKEKVQEATKKQKKGKSGDHEYGVVRGVDFQGVNFVVNVDFPRDVANYTHRIGRTARGTFICTR